MNNNIIIILDNFVMIYSVR